MYVKLEPFGYNVYGETIGSIWLSLVEAIIKNGISTEDEDRKRLSLQNIRIKSATQQFPKRGLALNLLILSAVIAQLVGTGEEDIKRRA